jgi:uncharacterized protein YlaI
MEKVSSCKDGKVCEGYGCLAIGSKTIKVDVGHKGSITLFLCQDCESRFSTHSAPPRTDSVAIKEVGQK